MKLNINDIAVRKRMAVSSKLFLFMKLTAILLTLTFLQVSATSFSQNISLSGRDLSLKQVFNKIKQQSGYSFFYKYKDLEQAKPVTLNVEGVTVKQVLDLCFKNQPFSYVIENKTIVINKKAEPEEQPLKAFLTVNGKVTDERGLPLIGASVRVKGASTASSTNAAGEFVLNGVNANAVIVVSYTGFIVQEIELKGRTSITVALKEDMKSLDEVMVTALGITKEQKSLGYSAQKIEGAELNKAPTTNWVNALTGKVAGLQLNKIGGPLGSSDVVLRGDNVMALGGSTAMIVIDGVPVSTSQTGTGNGSLVDPDNPIDFGSSLSDLNPEDIESISVLKGPGAAALYGSRASNGAIIITTKSGNKSPGLGVYFNSSTTLSTINRWPDYQYEYGAGAVGSTYYSYGATADGASTKNATAGYGPKFMGQSYFQFNSPFDASINPDAQTAARTERVPWVPYRDNISGFFETGVNVTNTVGLSGAGYRASLSHTKNKWIAPNTGFERLNVSLGGSQKISPKISLNTKLNYNRKFSDNLPGQGYNNQSIMYFMAQTAPSFDINWFKQHRFTPGKEGLQEWVPVSNGYLDNPYTISYDMLNPSDKHNVIGNINTTVQFTKQLSLMLRSGLDLSYEFRSQERPIGTYKYKEGMYRQQNVYRLESNSDFLLKYEHAFPFGLQYSISGGGNQRFNDYKYDDAMATKLAVANAYNLSNSKDPVQTVSDRYQSVVNSLYAFLNLNYKDKLYVEITGRNDWSSRLPANNASFFYPSVNTSVLLHRITKLPQVISFAKLRASYASTGVDNLLDPYGFLVNYSRTSFSGSLQLPGSLSNPDLKPQLTSALETGMDLRFFNDRLGLDLAVYKNVTRNQITNLPVSIASGFGRAITNIGKVQNNGIEVQLRGKIIDAPAGFKWNTVINWSANKSKVLDVSSSLNSSGQVVLYNVAWANISIIAEEGKSLGQLYGLGFKRSPDGQIIYNSAGVPVVDNLSLKNWGSINPDWQGGIQNNLSYKNLNLSFLFDFRSGGKMMSYSHAILSATGKLKNSLPGRDEGVTGPGVQQLADGSFVPNTAKTPAGTYYNAYYLYTNMEANVFSTSFVKFREASLNYGLPKSWFKKTIIQELNLGVSGRDLFIWSKFPLFDPETATFGSGANVMPGIEIGQFPSTRSFMMNLSAKF